MELGLIFGRNLEKPGKRQNLGVFQGFSRFNFLFLPFSRLFQVFQVFQVTWQPWTYEYGDDVVSLICITASGIDLDIELTDEPKECFNSHLS